LRPAWSGALLDMQATTLADSSQLGLRTDDASESQNRLLGLIASGLIGTIAFAHPLGAEELVPHARYFSGEAYSELRSYVQQLGDEQLSVDSLTKSPHNFTPIHKQAFSALRDFVQQSGGEQSDPVSRSPLTHHHSAPASDEYLAVQNFVREIGGGTVLRRRKATSFCWPQESSRKRLRRQRRNRPSRSAR
jgi:hypothetical protein